MITPKSDPHRFYKDTDTIQSAAIYRQIEPTMRLQRALRQAGLDAYRKDKPEECTPEINEEKYLAWKASDLGDMLYSAAITPILFCDENGSPLAQDVLDDIPNKIIADAYFFTKPRSVANTNEPIAPAPSGTPSPVSSTEEKNPSTS